MSRHRALGRQALRLAKAEPYVCQSCLLKGTVQPLERTAATRWQSSRAISGSNKWSSAPRDCLTLYDVRFLSSLRPLHNVRKQRYGTNGALASATAINAPSIVPSQYRELYQQLLLLQDEAASFVDESRIQLAMRSLESADPVHRIAFLGLAPNGVRAARKLARALLSDPLEQEEEWERDLLNESEDTNILLRYGDYVGDTGVQGANLPVKTISIPSPILEKARLEILITATNFEGFVPDNREGLKGLEETILVPPIAIPNSSDGRAGIVRYPVHRTLIVTEGLGGAVEYGRLSPALAEQELISAALSIPLRQSVIPSTSEEEITSDAVDIGLASHALTVFRANKADSSLFSEEWQTSRVPAILNWLVVSSNTTETQSLKPIDDLLLRSILLHAESSIATAEVQSMSMPDGLSIPDQKRNSLQNSLSKWAEDAHRDLQDNLNSILAFPTWQRTVWWRLFWRIDEVSMSAADVLRRGWLVEAEQSLAFLSGRILEAGVARVDQLKAEPLLTISESPSAVQLPNTATEGEASEKQTTTKSGVELQSIDNAAELKELPPVISRVEEEGELKPLFSPPWPQAIHFARQQMLHQVIPTLHRKAQGLLLSALSTVGGSTALATWLFVASSGTALYEAGAIGALGLVWSLRRLQTKWGKERAEFAETAREDGRKVLAEVEKRLAVLITTGGTAESNGGDLQELQTARTAIKRVQNVLHGLREQKTTVSQ